MKKFFALMLLTVAAWNTYAQEETPAEQPQTLFSPMKLPGVKSSGFYGAVTNSFSSMNGDFVNLSGLYGGWFINRKLLLGLGGATTNTTMRVPEAYKTIAGADLRYQYAQFGLFTEYVVNSNKKVHFAFNMLSGAGFTAQYLRHDRDEHNYGHYSHDTNFFAVLEPGAQVEINVLKWVRFSPGISYRQTIGSDAKGFSDSDLSNVSANLTLKFGLF